MPIMKPGFHGPLFSMKMISDGMENAYFQLNETTDY